MGAFGRLLQSYFGGTRHDVSTWGKSKPKSKERLRCEKCGRFAKKLVYNTLTGKYECYKD